MQIDTRACALWLAQRGYYIGRLLPGSKIPPKNFKWREQSTTDLSAIDKWFDDEPDGNFLIDAGRSNLLVIDPDVKGGINGPAVFKDWSSERGVSWETPIVLTPNGGLHIYYRRPAGYRGSNTPGNLPKGIDVRGSGGYVVGPGSKMEVDGEVSYWLPYRHSETGASSMSLTPLEAPVALLRALTPDRLRFSPVSFSTPYRELREEIDRALRYIESATQGNRNVSLLYSALAMGNLVGRDRIGEREAMLLLGDRAMSKKMPAGEARATIRNGLRMGIENAEPYGKALAPMRDAVSFEGP